MSTMKPLKSFLSLILAAVVWTAVAVPGVAAEPPAAPRHLVLCWYMVCFGNSVEGYKQEIRWPSGTGSTASCWT